MKPLAVVGVFVAGIAAGTIGTRVLSPADDRSHDRVVVTGPAASVPIPAAPASLPHSPAPAVDPAKAAVAAASSPVPGAHEAIAPANGAAAEHWNMPNLPPPSGNDALSLKLGPDLAASLALQMNMENSTGKLHEALEAEPRDDTWAYAAEADIQNALVADASAGNFTVNRVECRATLCELHLTGTDAQGPALQAWNDGLSKQAWWRDLPMSAQTMVSSKGKIEELLIFRRAPAVTSH